MLGAVAICFALIVTAEARPRQQIETCDNNGRCFGETYNAAPQGHGVSDYGDGRIVEHPAGCPARLFCGCGVSVKVFGKPVRDLYLASNWRRFPASSPGPGMVAWNYAHVMYIMSYNGDGTALVYDPNSGGHRTRIHVRPLAGYRIVNPNARVAFQ
jgi:hypothetical protein